MKYTYIYMQGEKPGNKYTVHLKVNSGSGPWKKEGKAREYIALTAAPTSRRPIICASFLYIIWNMKGLLSSVPGTELSINTGW